ncbi:hypothetical protein [Vitreoscilla stercoraria]|uniref:Uncharacterized protein n=1 Tax=Vitreoscilla stercoraria TaxID=61 RepID=A0ABY4EDS7_VITST|nr:hypothetical protein [Vitreoscilla stercoraria]UOO93602.1 hypothetical protein LVJ81_06145 [Vitreoscilla stercoraria]
MFINDEVLTGLQRLMALRLAGSPPADAIAATASVWMDAVSRYPIAWNEQQDTQRIRAAFDKLVWECDKWPSVKQFLNALPPRPLPPLLGKAKMSQQQLDEGRLNIQKILDNLEKKRIPNHDGKAALEQAIQMTKEQQA